MEKQKLDLLHEANTDVTNLEKERCVLMRAFKKVPIQFKMIMVIYFKVDAQL